MRLPAAIVVASLIGASLIGAALTAAPAQAEDRFGPARAVAAAQVAPSPAAAFDSDRALAWGGKMRPRDLSTSDTPAERPTPLVDGLLRHTSAAPRIVRAPVASAPPSASPAPRPYAAQSVQLRGSVPARAPAPAPAQAPTRAPAPAAAPAPARVSNPAPAPARAPTPTTASVAPIAPTAPTAVVAGLSPSMFDETPAPAPEPTITRSRPVTLAGAPGAAGTTTVGSRYYSLHRGYGVEPDPIPMTQTGVGQ